MKLAETDLTAKEKEGKWFKYRDHHGNIVPGVELLIASLECEGYVLEVQKKMRADANRALGGKRGKKEILPDIERQAEVEDAALARHILLDWKGIENDDNDDPQPCTLENRLKALGRPRFREFVIDAAGDTAAYEEAELGNSPNTHPTILADANSSSNGSQ